VGVNRERLKKDIGARIFAFRAGKKLTQAELTDRIAARLGESVSEGQVGRWEKGENLPAVDALLALAAELETSLEELVMGQESFAERVERLVLARVEPRINRIEKHVGLKPPEGSPT
jgi:transcriptional regulator with XRE-family HTH domain